MGHREGDGRSGRVATGAADRTLGSDE